MKVTIRYVNKQNKGQVENIVHCKIAFVLYEKEWLKLYTLDEKQITYRMEGIFAVIEEKEKKCSKS